MLLFQHNNLKATEWMAIRRELAQALRKVDHINTVVGPDNGDIADGIKIQVIKAGIFGAALRVVEYFDPEARPMGEATPSSDSAKQLSSHPKKKQVSKNDPALTHALSTAAYEAAKAKKHKHLLEPLLSGPLAVLSFPAVSTEHLKAALSILAPHAPTFAAPTRRANPGFYEPTVQSGLQKLLLLGARIEGRVFDLEGIRWVGSIEGGLSGLRAQLVTMLQGLGANVTSTLENAGKSLYFTVESRRRMMEEESSESKDNGNNNEAPPGAPSVP